MKKKKVRNIVAKETQKKKWGSGLHECKKHKDNTIFDNLETKDNDDLEDDSDFEDNDVFEDDYDFEEDDNDFEDDNFEEGKKNLSSVNNLSDDFREWTEQEIDDLLGISNILWSKANE